MFILKEISKDISIKNEKTFITLLVGLGHIAFYIPNLVGNDLKTFIAQNVYKELLYGQNEPKACDENHAHRVRLL